jgi:hypothetical protein
MFYVILFQQIGKKKNDGMNGALRARPGKIGGIKRQGDCRGDVPCGT